MKSVTEPTNIAAAAHNPVAWAEKAPLAEALKIGSERQLFIDDYCIEEMCGVRKVFHQAKKHPANPILMPEEPWEREYAQVYGNVIFDPEMQLYRMWYSARYFVDGDPNGEKLNTVCHATSEDGINWERSKLNLLEHNGLVLTNALMKGVCIGPTVFYTPEDPDPGRKFRMYVFTGPEMMGMDDRRDPNMKHHYSVFFSPDGFVWTPYEGNPVVPGGDIATCAYDPVTKQYMAFVRTHRTDDGLFRRCVGVTTSTDFVNWQSHDIILSADKVDDARVESRLTRFRNLLIFDDPSFYHGEMYGMTGFRYEGMRLGLIWFYDLSSMRADGQNDDGIVNIQLAYSRHPSPHGFWYRAGDREDFLPCGDEGEFDCGSICTGHTVLEHGDELWFYYSGVSRSHAFMEWEPARPLTKTPFILPSIGLATLRLDGFASIDALYAPGRMTTKLITFKGEKLVINADAEEGAIAVELTDHEGRPIPGYTKEECVPFRRDDVRGEVEWKNGGSLASLKGKQVHIVFHMRTARLYSFKIS